MRRTVRVDLKFSDTVTIGEIVHQLIDLPQEMCLCDIEDDQSANPKLREAALIFTDASDE